jgi:hypothetical protein
MRLRASGGHGRDERLDVLKGALLCGLLLTASAPAGALPLLLRAGLSLLAGRAFATGLRRAESAGRRPERSWLPRIALVWIASFTPAVLLANPDAVRSFAVVAGLALLIRGLPTRGLLVLAGGLLAVSVAATGATPHAGAVGTIEHALGATWPRGWSDVARLGALFLLGGVWARGGEAAPGAAEGTWTRALAPLGWLGRAPLVALLAHALLTLALQGSAGGVADSSGILVGASVWALVGALLLVRRPLRRVMS